ncbi:MAG TPA: hypothetical protein VNO21_24955 [Polyangiaceae bacterium]|nr:hypothetical protein [Polyangiaceae bacterium]
MAPTLDDLLKELRAIRHEVGITRVLAEASLGDAIAPEDDMEDPIVRFNPNSWKGDSYKLEPFSKCSPEFLEHLARALSTMALRNKEMGKRYNGKPTWPFTLQTAARARRWALRMRLGWTPTRAPDKPAGNPFRRPQKGDADNDGEGDDFPFGANANGHGEPLAEGDEDPL